jgi:hypothetical protein
MTLRSLIFASVLPAIAVTASAQGQGPDITSGRLVLAIGSRVRITSTALQGRPKGLVVALDESVVTLATDGGLPVKIPLASITALETSLGRKRNWLKGAAIGAVGGLIVGLAAPVDPNDLLCGSSSYSTNFCSRGEAVATSSLGGAVLGAGIGALIRSDRWSAVTLTVARPQGRYGQSALRLVATVRF